MCKAKTCRLVRIQIELLDVDDCQETSTRDTANKRSLELCASIVLLFLDGCSKWYVSVVFLTCQHGGQDDLILSVIQAK